MNATVVHSSKVEKKSMFREIGNKHQDLQDPTQKMNCRYLVFTCYK